MRSLPNFVLFLFLIYKDIMRNDLNPRIWKFSYIIPIHKKGKTYDPCIIDLLAQHASDL